MASDEGIPVIGARLAGINVENTPESRQKFRHMMYKTEGLSKFLGGVILEKETFAQKDADGNRVCAPLLDAGIKVWGRQPILQIKGGL